MITLPIRSLLRLMSLLVLFSVYLPHPTAGAGVSTARKLVNHIKNPGFETGILAPWYHVSDSGGSVSIMKNGPENPPGDETPYGQYFLQLFVSSNSPATISQHFPLHKHTNYTVSWSISLLDFPEGTGAVEFNVSYAGVLLRRVVLDQGLPPWSNYSATFRPVAHEGNLTWIFAVEAQGGGSVIAGVDDWGVVRSR